MNCRIAAPWVTALGSGDDVSFAPVRHHIASCLYCQASIARQRRLRRSLQDLADTPAIAPTGSSPSSAPLGATGRGRPLIIGAIGAAIAVGLGVVGFRRAAAG